MRRGRVGGGVGRGVVGRGGSVGERWGGGGRGGRRGRRRGGEEGEEEGRGGRRGGRRRRRRKNGEEKVQWDMIIQLMKPEVSNISRKMKFCWQGKTCLLY